MGQHHGAVAGVVARSRVALLVARVVLLVHDDQSEAAERQEERRTGPDDQLAARRTGQPQADLRAASGREFRVVGGNAAAEDTLQAFDKLCREGDFGDEKDDGFLRSEGF